MGDKKFSNGVCSESVILDTTQKFDTGERAFLLVACDGMLGIVIKGVDSPTEEGRIKIKEDALGFMFDGGYPD